MGSSLLAGWASEAQRIYRWVRKSAFLLGVVVTATISVAFSWYPGWVITALLSLIVVRSFVAPDGSIDLDLMLDAIVLGLITWILDVPAGWVILAFPIAFAALLGSSRSIATTAALGLCFGLAPLLAPGLVVPDESAWAPDWLTEAHLDDETGGNMSSGVLVSFLIIAIAAIGERMRSLEQTRSRALAATAHDLRNSAAAVHGLGTALLDDELSDAGRDLAVALVDSAEENLRLTDDLFALARFFIEPEASESAAFELGEVTERLLAGRPDVQLREHSPTWAVGDRGRAAQVIRNLVANASMHGAPPIEVRIRRDGTQALVAVSDRGPGVPPTVEDTLFAESHSTGEGLGIGLATSRGFAEQMHGGLTYRRDGDETIFTLSLPLSDAHH